MEACFGVGGLLAFYIFVSVFRFYLQGSLILHICICFFCLSSLRVSTCSLTVVLVSLPGALLAWRFACFEVRFVRSDQPFVTVLLL